MNERQFIAFLDRVFGYGISLSLLGGFAAALGARILAWGSLVLLIAIAVLVYVVGNKRKDDE